MINVLIATQSHRARLLQPIITALNNNTLLPDRITIIYQGYYQSVKSTVPILFVKNQTNKGSTNRFRHASNKGINITIDDDFIPSKHYIEHLIAFNSDNPDCIGSLWGYRMAGFGDYHKTWQSIESWKELLQDTRCIMLGAGLMVWDESLIPISTIQFENDCFADIQIAHWALLNYYKTYCIAHKGDECEHQGHDDIQQNAIWEKAKKDHSYLDFKTNEIISIFTR